ncbi:MAG TPA: glycosyltransferase family 4 protein [Albitalea sp.]|uniref:glycosyltransferase family 4 protein n=1 Tax=Piscinibacter sp. TaxID=1903157 RepID=UPI002ED2754C
MSPAPAARSIAVLDGGSFVLPYDFQLVKALAARGWRVAFHGSRTRYNGEFLDAMRSLTGVSVHSAGVSGTVNPRWKGVLAYAALLFGLWRRRRGVDTVNLQFSAWWPLELPFLFALRRRLVFTVHNAVPHGFRGTSHAPTGWIAAMARALVFVSEATRDDFLRRYGERFRDKASVLPHGLLPIAPELGATPYVAGRPVRSLVFWSTVKPYKGVELFAELARSARIRERGLTLQVCGAWAPELKPLRDELLGLGVQVRDGYLDREQLLGLLAEDAVFLLPYRDASQSGALYALLNHGCRFICADAGDLGAFMRRFGLEGLLLRERSADAVADCLDHLEANGTDAADALQRAQDAHAWDRLLKDYP